MLSGKLKDIEREQELEENSSLYINDEKDEYDLLMGEEYVDGEMNTFEVISPSTDERGSKRGRNLTYNVPNYYERVKYPFKKLRESSEGNELFSSDLHMKFAFLKKYYLLIYIWSWHFF